MALFDSIISEATEKFGLGNKSGGLLAALLGLMSDKTRGGFSGFMDLFTNAGLGDTASSWVNTGSNTLLSDEQTESALGGETIDRIASQSGVGRASVLSALSYLIPNVVDRLTPDGVMPNENDFLSKIGSYLTGGAAAATTAAAASMVDKDTVTVFDNREQVRTETVPPAGEVIPTTRTVDRVDVVEDNSGGSILNWLLPLLLLGLLLLLGFWFCRPNTTTVTNTTVTNTNVNKNTNATVTNTGSVNANVSNVNASNMSNMNNSTAVVTRTLGEVTLPPNTKLQAYPGGIEDQLIKFIQSDEYKNGTADSLKDKWFSFDDLNFKFGTTELVPESKRQLDNITAILKAYPDVKIKIGGYTDKKGDDAANKKLSDGRAKAVQAALQKAGVGAQVPEAEGYGEQFATVPETAGDKEREADRKTSVRLLK